MNVRPGNVRFQGLYYSNIEDPFYNYCFKFVTPVSNDLKSLFKKCDNCNGEYYKAYIDFKWSGYFVSELTTQVTKTLKVFNNFKVDKEPVSLFDEFSSSIVPLGSDEAQSVLTEADKSSLMECSKPSNTGVSNSLLDMLRASIPKISTTTNVNSKNASSASKKDRQRIAIAIHIVRNGLERQEKSNAFWESLLYLYNEQAITENLYESLTSKRVMMEGGKAKKLYNGRQYMVRTGPKGGKFILVKGKKVYV
jgi:hypothetical protein